MEHTKTTVCLCWVDLDELEREGSLPPFRQYLHATQPETAIVVVPQKMTETGHIKLTALLNGLSPLSWSLSVLESETASWTYQDWTRELSQKLDFLDPNAHRSFYWFKKSPELETCILLLRPAAYPDLELVRGTFDSAGASTYREHYQDQVPFSITAELRHPTNNQPSDDPFRYLSQNSESMKRAIQDAKLFATDLFPILLLGEAGVGKEKFARAIHQASGLSGDCQTVNCTEFANEHAAEVRLFGHQKEPGLLEKADSGSLFLDRIASLAISTQAKLLAVLEGKPWVRTEGSLTIKTTVRILAGEIFDLRDLAKQGKIHPDLLGRLGHEYVIVPPLRERIEDVDPLANQWLSIVDGEMKARSVVGWKTKKLQAEALTWMNQQPWNGNVRELRRVLRSCCRRFPGAETITRAMLEKTMHLSTVLVAPKASEIRVEFTNSSKDMKDVFEEEMVFLAWEMVAPLGRTKKVAAQSIGMDEASFGRVLKRYFKRNQWGSQ